MSNQDNLKPREIEILRLMTDGLTNREIAEQLYIGVETVRWYAKQIYSKLVVSGRDEAAKKARALGILNEGQQVDERPEVGPRHNLPTQLTSFIGREQQIDEITALLSKTRLLTLTGPGGTGKTRLSLKVAEYMIEEFPDGVYFVDLAPVADHMMVASTIAHTLGVLESGNQPIVATLTSAIGQRKILLILDNYEHVIDAAPVVADLLVATQNVRVMVTSREALRVSGEQVYSVPSMTLPKANLPEHSESVALFVQRSQAVKQHFQLDGTNAQAIIDICQHLDGIPLAIELAAALSRFLTPDAILSRMNNRIQNLKGGSRDAPARQQTLRNTIDWSYELLEEGEKTLFVRLAVFRGGRSLDAIEAVCGDDIPIEIFDGLAALVDKNMIRQIEDLRGEPRFVMLETIQEYAWQCLEESGEADTFCRIHAEYFADFTARAKPYLRKAGYDYWFQRLNIEQDNIRAALQWALFGGDVELGLRIVDALGDFWFYEGYHVEGQRWAEQALEHLDDVAPALQVGVLETLWLIAYGRQELAQSIAFQRQALALARDIGDGQRTGWLLLALAACLYDNSSRTQKDYDDAMAMCHEGLAILRKHQDKVWLAQGLNVLGNIQSIQGHHALARETYEECLRLSRETGERRREVMALGNLSVVAIGLGNYEDAYQLACESLKLSRDLQFDYNTVLALGRSLPASLINLDSVESAATLLGASEALQEAMNIRQQPNNMPEVERVHTEVREKLSVDAFQTAYERGRNMSLDEAVDFALRPLSDD